MRINIHKEVEIEPTIRTELLGSMFEIPTKQKLSVTLTGDLPLVMDNVEHPWNIGLIVGPSGSGKTLLLNELFGRPQDFSWNSKSIIDDFPQDKSMEEIARVCQSVGFNTIPSYLRPYSVLSNGERFRAEVARRLLWPHGVVSIDEFTSVVDRQVAQFACHSIQKYIRECEHKRLVAASCHYDIIPWLQPDWLLEPGNPCRFTWRSLQRRPSIDVSVSRVKYETWKLFAPFHYMSAELNKAARCYGLFVREPEKDEELRDMGGEFQPKNDDVSSGGHRGVLRVYRNTRNSDVGGVPQRGLDRPSSSTETFRIASMCGVLYRPHPRVSDIYGFTRMVTLPDFQGLGLAFVLACKVASAYKALGKRLHSYPNHPAWIRSYQRSSDWMQIKNSGDFSPRRGSTSTVGGFGGRRCAVFQYIGDAMSREEAERLINVD